MGFVRKAVAKKLEAAREQAVRGHLLPGEEVLNAHRVGMVMEPVRRTTADGYLYFTNRSVRFVATSPKALLPLDLDFRYTNVLGFRLEKSPVFLMSALYDVELPPTMVPLLVRPRGFELFIYRDFCAAYELIVGQTFNNWGGDDPQELSRLVSELNA